MADLFRWVSTLHPDVDQIKRDIAANSYKQLLADSPPVKDSDGCGCAKNEDDVAAAPVIDLRFLPPLASYASQQDVDDPQRIITNEALVQTLSKFWQQAVLPISRAMPNQVPTTGTNTPKFASIQLGASTTLQPAVDADAVSYILPKQRPLANQVLSSNAVGQLTWVDLPGAANTAALTQRLNELTAVVDILTTPVLQITTKALEHDTSSIVVTTSNVGATFTVTVDEVDQERASVEQVEFIPGSYLVTFTLPYIGPGVGVTITQNSAGAYKSVSQHVLVSPVSVESATDPVAPPIHPIDPPVAPVESTILDVAEISLQHGILSPYEMKLGATSTLSSLFQSNSPMPFILDYTPSEQSVISTTIVGGEFILAPTAVGQVTISVTPRLQVRRRPMQLRRRLWN
jgi:hypothetical protein